MINHGKIHSSTRPQEIEMTATAVFVASNITSSIKEIEERTQEVFEYDYVEYSKDEYLTMLAQELAAAKILLGVD